MKKLVKTMMWSLCAFALSASVMLSSCSDDKDDPVVEVTDVKLSETTLTLLEGASEPLAAVIEPVDAAVNRVTWASSNESVATVDAFGKVTAVSFGETIITATAGGKKAECNVTVNHELLGTQWVGNASIMIFTFDFQSNTELELYYSLFFFVPTTKVVSYVYDKPNLSITVEVDGTSNSFRLDLVVENDKMTGNLIVINEDGEQEPIDIELNKHVAE